jgi:hypothetical protein
MGTDANSSKSGSSRGTVGNGFSFSGGSPGIGSGFSFSGNSPTRPLVRSILRVVLTQQFHPNNFRAVEVNRPSAPVCAFGGFFIEVNTTASGTRGEH